MLNAEFSKLLTLHSADYQPDANLKKFANDYGENPGRDICEKSSSETAILRGAKILIFRKFRKRFSRKVAFAKKKHDAAKSQISKNPQNEPFAKSPFFARDFGSNRVYQ